MRNKITVLDPVDKRLTVLDLNPGHMFRYTDQRSEDAVYMKIDGFSKGNAAVLLATGMYYEVALGASIERVKQLQIG